MPSVVATTPFEISSSMLAPKTDVSEEAGVGKEGEDEGEDVTEGE